MHARVVELDALADPVGTGAEDEDRGPRARGDLGLLVVGRVVVRRAGGELGGAGVHRLEDRAQADGVPAAADRVLRRAAQGRDLRVRQAVPLGVQQHLAGQRVGGRGSAPPTSLISWTWSRNQGSMPVQLVDLSPATPRRAAPAARRRGGARSAGRSSRRARRAPRPPARRPPSGRPSPSCRCERMRLAERLGEVAAQGHRLADRLHGRGQRVVGRRELLEREPRDLDDDVVERRLEGRRRRAAGDVVRDLVERVADRELGGDLRDREAGRLRRQRATTGTRAGSSR